MDSSYWKVWRNRRGKVKGAAIVFRASDIGLELHSDLVDESDRAELAQDLCDKLNRAEGRYVAPRSESREGASLEDREYGQWGEERWPKVPK